MYKIEFLLKDHSILPEAEQCYLEGEIEDCLVLSVPITTSRKTQGEICGELGKKFNKHVVVISHNMAFMKAVKLPAKEAAKIIKECEDYAEANTDKEQPGDTIGDDGDRSGVGVNGRSDIGKDGGIN